METHEDHRVTPAAHDLPSHVVGIGASAGGLDAIERFFDHLPSDTGMAFVLVQHLSPDFKSLMDELLARHTSLPILHVVDGMEVRANHVYLIPPKKEMIIAEGRLLLSERDRQQELTLPIDVFFRSLAQDCGKRAVAIVLSGGGSDGSRGIRAVHEAGGLVLVQSAESAQFDGMPRAAREAGVAAHLIAPEEMPHFVVEYGKFGADLPAAEADPGDLGLQVVYGMLQQEFGIDFTHYKPSTVTRRIERRLQLARATDIKEYVARLRGSRDELDILYRDLLIGVTHFFRNEEAFAALEQRVLPELLQQDRQGQPFRVWVAGCATGEEVYSLAMVLQELSTRFGERPVKIFATDVHRGSLENAATAIYDEAAVARVPRARLERHFVRRGDKWQVTPELRSLVVFAAHNVVRDPPFTRMNLISCRNMLIYLQPAAQQKVLSLFHFALVRGGIMFLGPSETIGNLNNDFETVDRQWRVYRKFSDVRMPVDTRLAASRRLDGRPDGQQLTTPSRPSPVHLLGVYDALLERHMPESLLLNEHGEVVHTFGGASRHLRFREGRQGLDVLPAVDGELKLVLATGRQRALREPNAIVFTGVRLGPEHLPHRVTLSAVRARVGPPHILVSFEPVATDGAVDGVHGVDGVGHRALAAMAAPTQVDVDTAKREQVHALEAELVHTKENLQAVVEELEASNEELQAANEELLSSNEELQSTNEELQSVNEELYTVNAEYQRKIGELTELTNDVDNLLASTEVGTIFLDRDLKIRKFTPTAAQSFNLLAQDAGRSIEAFTHDFDHPDLIEDLRRVLATGAPVEREVRDARGRAYFLRILPYMARGSREGVVITLIDVSGLKAAEDALFHERYLLNSLLETVPDAIYFKDARGRFIRANQPFAELTGTSGGPPAITAKTALDLPHRALALDLHGRDEAVLRAGKAEHYQLEPRQDGAGVRRWYLATRLPLIDKTPATVGVIGILRDVTEQVLADEKVQEAVRRRDQFLAMLSHELRNPLSAIVTAVSMVRLAGVSDKQTRLVQVLDRQSKQMARLLDDLLDVSRVTQSKIELKRSAVDLRAVIRDAAEAMRSQLTSREISFRSELDTQPLTIDGDAARLQQVIVNLLHNAAKYSERGGNVLLTAKREAAWAVVRVRDDGAGIAPQMLDSVFELFVQANRTLDRAQGGIGVGLTLVRALVDMHGGSVAARSEGVGKGSEFEIRLPLVNAVPTRSEGDGEQGEAPVPKGATVVVVEDNEDGRELLCEVLRGAGYNCHAAADGEEGLELIARMRPEAAVVDIGLPALDGLELARRVRRDPGLGSVFLVALTGYGRDTDRETAQRAGFDAHLVKPTDPQALLRLFAGRRS
jgi:two-component system CheB/CheR fusion protein